MVEFISYDGSFPNLCSGTLMLKIDGEIVSWQHCLRSGGTVWFDDNWSVHVETGEWTVNIPEEYEKYREEITDIVNSNIPYGCCGGCV